MWQRHCRAGFNMLHWQRHCRAGFNMLRWQRQSRAGFIACCCGCMHVPQAGTRMMRCVYKKLISDRGIALIFDLTNPIMPRRC